MFFVRCQLFKILQPVDRINQSRYNNCKNNYCILVQIKNGRSVYAALLFGKKFVIGGC